MFTFNMDYIYHYWTYPMLFSGHCSCTCFTCLYKVDLVLLLIVIYLLLRDKVTINIDTSTYRLPLVPVNDNLNMSNVVSSTTEPISLPSSKLTPSNSSIISSSSPWDNMLISNGEALINSERSTPSDPPESLPESLNSFGSLGSIRRKLIKPDISLDFLDLSSSEEDESDNETGGKLLRKSKDIDTDSLEECNVYSGCTNDEHFYRDTSLSEETFTNDRITIVPLVSNSQPVDNKVTFIAC